MSDSVKINEAVHEHDDESDPLTEEEIDAIQGYRDGRIKGIKFETADEAIRWLNR